MAFVSGVVGTRLEVGVGKSSKVCPTISICGLLEGWFERNQSRLTPPGRLESSTIVTARNELGSVGVVQEISRTFSFQKSAAKEKIPGLAPPERFEAAMLSVAEVGVRSLEF